MPIPIIFDLDGTLFDCKDLTNQTIPHVLKELERKYSTKLHIQKFDRYDKFLGMVTEDIFAKLLPNAGEEIVKEAKQLLIDIELELIPKSGKLFQYVKQTLQELSNMQHPLFIASNGSKEYVHRVLEVFEIRNYFIDVYSAGEYETDSKTDLVKLLLKTHTLNGKCVMVGDRSSDIEAGRMNGLLTIGCQYGFGDEEEIINADFKIQSIKDLILTIDTK
jgi:phosphoglycolate phosphatase